MVSRVDRLLVKEGRRIISGSSWRLWLLIPICLVDALKVQIHRGIEVEI